VSPGLRVRCDILLWRHGWIWPLAAALVLAAWALDRQADRSQRHAGELRAALHSGAMAQPRADEAAPGRRAGLVPAELAAAPDVATSVARMLALAQAAGLEIAQAEYLHGEVAELRLPRTQITQPVRATYPQLRRYLESVLRELPHASLDHVAARRESVGQGQLEVRLQWSLWGPVQEKTP
jgi:hypothetical protein